MKAPGILIPSPLVLKHPLGEADALPECLPSAGLSLHKLFPAPARTPSLIATLGVGVIVSLGFIQKRRLKRILRSSN